MSTVSKQIADAIIAGEFPEDECIVILRYENAFNGDYAYKCIFGRSFLITSETVEREILNCMLSINTGAPVKIYWCENWVKRVLDKSEWISKENFVERD